MDVLPAPHVIDEEQQWRGVLVSRACTCRTLAKAKALLERGAQGRLQDHHLDALPAAC